MNPGLTFHEPTDGMINKKAFQSNANCSLANRPTNYIVIYEHVLEGVLYGKGHNAQV